MTACTIASAYECYVGISEASAEKIYCFIEEFFSIRMVDEVVMALRFFTSIIIT